MQSLQRRALPYPPLLQPVIFGGEKGARNVPAGAGPGLSVDAAKQLEKSGASAPEIFQQTGWYHAPDGQWKWTLSDKGADFNPNAVQTYKSGDPMGLTSEQIKAIPDSVRLKSGGPQKLSDVLIHPNLYETYPNLKNATIERLSPQDARAMGGASADYNYRTNTVRIADDRPKGDVLQSLLHELQHDVQHVEGFGGGAAPSEYYPADVQAGKRPLTQEDQKRAIEDYRRTSGEVEARQVQKQFETRNWSQLPTQMDDFPAPSQQLVVPSGNQFTVSPGKSYQLVPVDHDPFTTTPVDYDPFSAKPVDHDPYAPPTNVYEHALQQYPILRDQGVMGVQGDRSRLESWPANEPGAPGQPRPAGLPMDKFGVEYREQDRPIDILGDVVSHHMVNKDPVIKRYYERFVESLTPEQQQRLQEQYQYAQQNEGETRPYEQWEEKSGLPAYFRGYAFQQWPDEVNQQAYTPEQRGHFDRMMTYLQGPQESPTPY